MIVYGCIVRSASNCLPSSYCQVAPLALEALVCICGLSDRNTGDADEEPRCRENTWTSSRSSFGEVNLPSEMP